MAKYVIPLICLFLLFFHCLSELKQKPSLKNTRIRSVRGQQKLKAPRIAPRGVKRLLWEELRPAWGARHFMAISNGIKINRLMRRGK